MTDEDGYPEPEEIAAIAEFDGDNPHEWMDLIRPLWWAESSLFEHSNGHYWLHTGGWSGNEELVAAMRGHFHWYTGFRSHHCGGHYHLHWRIERPVGVRDGDLGSAG